MNLSLSGEAKILALIDKHFSSAHSGFSIARGDDCAIFHPGAPIAVSSDLFLEDVHFRRSYFSASETGRKALAVNLSDLAACAAAPFAFSLCLGLPADLESSWLEGFFTGMASLAEEHGLFLCGGDLSSAEKIQVGITIMGQKPADGVLLARGKGRPGDLIFLAGETGLARTGLCLLEREGRACRDLWPESFAAHIAPRPLVKTGLALGKFAQETGCRLSLMDVSDGIARDLPRLLDSGVGAALGVAEDTLHPELLCFCRSEGIGAVEFAILGGEDYALLGTCQPEFSARLAEAVPEVKFLGIATEGGGITCNEKPLGKGFDHFERTGRSGLAHL